MPIFAPESNWMVGRDAVKGCFAGEIPARPEILVPLASEYPATAGRLQSAFVHQGHCLVLTGTTCRIDVVGAIGCAEQVDVCVDKAWKHCSPAQVYQFAVPSSNAAYLVIVAYRQDIAVCGINGHRLRSRLCDIHG